MALDEVLLQSSQVAILRFYRWREATVSFGYFGKVAEARAFAAGRAMVRRWTGGGIVPHGDDLTYSLILPATAPATALSSPALYQHIHTTIAQCLARTGLRATLASGSVPRRSDACFANPVLADLMLNGHKIAGAAQRRTRTGLLHQGSIQLTVDEALLRQNLAAALADEVEIAQDTPTRLLEEAKRLAAQKYASERWLGRC
ncbi:MAG: hypothetical protein ABI839_03950 [Verrucomicrobiota bacterium]